METNTATGACKLTAKMMVWYAKFKRKDVKVGFENLCDCFIGTRAEVVDNIMKYYGKDATRTSETMMELLMELQVCWEAFGKREFYRIVDKKGVRDNIDEYLKHALKTSLAEKLREKQNLREQQDPLYQLKQRMENERMENQRVK